MTRLLIEDPLNPDENGDGVPDGILPSIWASHPLWAVNATNGATVTVTLLSPIPEGASATFFLDDLAIPLRAPASWSFALVAGDLHGYRLFVSNGATADLSITAVVPTRAGGMADGPPLWAEGGGDVFDGPSKGGAGLVAIPDIAFTGASFEICQPGFVGWQPLLGDTWTAKIAGTFQIRGTARAAGRDVSVGPITVWVQFPSETEMLADPAVIANANALWAQTLALCTQETRQEVGCWIKLDTGTGTYSFTPTILGREVGNDVDSNINLNDKPPDLPPFPKLMDNSATYIVGAFHTHTPTEYRTGPPRLAGP